MRTWLCLLGSLTLVAPALIPSAAHAGENDLVLSRLGNINATGNDVVPNNQEFRSLSSELGVLIAPKFLSPSDTLGYSGFQTSVEYGVTAINNSASYWCATEESQDCGPGQSKDNGYISTIGIFARKGMWLPIPSFELGAGAVHIGNTASMWSAQAYAKFAVHEGFHDWPIPSLAVRGAAARLMGSEQIDLTVASLDISVSKSFGVQGTVNLAPYAGWNYLWIVPRSEVLDKTPNVDIVRDDPMDINKNFVFPDQDNITRQRFFGGLKVKYYVFALTLEVNVALAGTSVDDRPGTDMRCDDVTADELGRCDAEDKSGAQQTYSLSISLDF